MAKSDKRKYQPIWEKIKQERVCHVSVHPLLFARLVKAVVKEKDKDLAFKVANDLDDCYLEILRDVEKQIITFKLKQRVGIADIVVV